MAKNRLGQDFTFYQFPLPSRREWFAFIHLLSVDPEEACCAYLFSVFANAGLVTTANNTASITLIFSFIFEFPKAIDKDKSSR